MIMIAGSTTCSTLSPIQPSCWWVGVGCGGNTGARTAGVDGHTARTVEMFVGVEEFLDGLRSQLKDRSFRPLPVRQRMIPKAGG